MKRAESAFGLFLIVIAAIAIALVIGGLSLVTKGLSGPPPLTTPGPTFHVLSGQYDCTLVYADGKWLWPPICDQIRAVKP